MVQESAESGQALQDEEIPRILVRRMGRLCDAVITKGMILAESTPTLQGRKGPKAFSTFRGVFPACVFPPTKPSLVYVNGFINNKGTN